MSRNKINRRVSKFNNATIEVYKNATYVEPSGSVLFFRTKKEFNDFVREVKRLHNEKPSEGF